MLISSLNSVEYEIGFRLEGFFFCFFFFIVHLFPELNRLHLRFYGRWSSLFKSKSDPQFRKKGYCTFNLIYFFIIIWTYIHDEAIRDMDIIRKTGGRATDRHSSDRPFNRPTDRPTESDHKRQWHPIEKVLQRDNSVPCLSKKFSIYFFYRFCSLFSWNLSALSPLSIPECSHFYPNFYQNL